MKAVTDQRDSGSIPLKKYNVDISYTAFWC